MLVKQEFHVVYIYKIDYSSAVSRNLFGIHFFYYLQHHIIAYKHSNLQSFTKIMRLNHKFRQK